MKRALTAILVGAHFIASSVARADETTAGDRAVELGHAGLAHYDQRDFAQAFSRLEEAERLTHSPVFVLYMARSKRQLGALIEASALFRRCASEVLPQDAPAAWARAKQDARTEGAEVESLIPSLALDIDPDDAEVALDDRPIALRGGRATLTLDPGRYRVRVTSGGKTETRTVSLRPAARESLSLSLFRATEEAESTPGSLVPGITLMAVGGAGLLAGVGTGIAAWVAADDIQSRCIGDSCLREDADEGARLNALTTASTVTFIAGGAIAATGIVLAIVRPGGGPAAEARIGPARADITLRF